MIKQTKKPPARLTPAVLAKVGAALHGPAWRAALAVDLEVSERTVRRWADGTTKIPQRVRVELVSLCQARGVLLANLVKILESEK